MSSWHREHPELVGTDADPWMVHESYRKALPPPLKEDRSDHDWESKREIDVDAQRRSEPERWEEVGDAE